MEKKELVGREPIAAATFLRQPIDDETDNGDGGDDKWSPSRTIRKKYQVGQPVAVFQ